MVGDGCSRSTAPIRHTPHHNPHPTHPTQRVFRSKKAHEAKLAVKNAQQLERAGSQANAEFAKSLALDVFK